MRLTLLGLLLGLISIVSALSATGNRLLVIAEDEAEKGKYSRFLNDVQSMLKYRPMQSRKWIDELINHH